MPPWLAKLVHPRGITKVLLGLLVVLLIASAALNLGPILGIGNDANSILTVLIGLAFTIIHGSILLGIRRLLTFLAITFVVSFSAEAIGVATGLVFGKYHYTGNLGPKVLGVPPLIQAGYVAMAYPSLIMARIILGVFQTPRGWQLVGVAICAAFIMVSWDVAMDPYQSTISGDWIWENGGPYFGVPLHNYVGWYCTVVTFILLYLVYELFDPLPPLSGPAANRFFLSEPVLYYALIGIGILITPLVYDIPLPIASPNNYSGSLDNLMQSMSLVVVFVMGTPVALALVRLLNHPVAPRGELRSPVGPVV